MLPSFLFLLVVGQLSATSLGFCPNVDFCGFDPPGEYSYRSELSKNEYIFAFKNYSSKTIRRQIIDDYLQSVRISRYNVVEKNKIFDTLPSDFDVVRIREKFEVPSIETLGKTKISGVYEHRKVIRSLKSDDYDDDQEQYLNLDEEILEAERRERKKKKKSNRLKPNKRKNRRIFRAIPKNFIDLLQVRTMWAQAGVTGANVNVAVLDTGLEENHPHFKYVRERIDWTDEGNPDDRIGHGTFVCGLIASSKQCLGLAPYVNLYVFKVFAKNQTSYTSWFLDAFNYILMKNIDVLNLSIGGPDFMDMPFVKKVREISSKGIIMVSGIGNDGPTYGTLSNPADQLDIIGVGGINSYDQITKFSSRGMTTWELPDGYGRVKPDLVTYCVDVSGSNLKSGCRTLSGTSVASPIVAGAASLLVSLKKLRPLKYEKLINPGSVKQVLMASADRLEDANIFEQGAGKLNLVRAYNMMRNYYPQASVIPSYLDLTECPYFWPYCSQPLYSSALPVIFNLTILNGMGVSGVVSAKPKWHPSNAENGQYLQMNFSYSEHLWPWSGYLAVRIIVSEEAADFSGIVEGKISVEIESLGVGSEPIKSPLEVFVRARIVPKPPRQQRLLWDQFHNLRYPSGYFPRDDLKMKIDPLDWNADHLHTNFKEMYQYLRNSGYFLEVLGENLNCFDASNYGALLIFDSEEEFFPSEVTKIYQDVISRGLSLIVFAEWYNSSVIKQAKFYDENTRKWWTPVTGGANVPALNNLLEPFGIGFGDRIFDGEFEIGGHSAAFVSGTSIVKFPRSASNYIVEKKLVDEGEIFLAESKNQTIKRKRAEKVTILGLAQTGEDHERSGRVVVYGDTNCVDSKHIKNDCFWLLSALIEYACHNLVYSGFKQTDSSNFISQTNLVKSSNENLKNYSKVLDREEPICARLELSTSQPIDQISRDEVPTKNNFYRFLRFDEKAVSIGFDEIGDDGREGDGLVDIDQSPGTKDSDVLADYVWNFPILAFGAVLLVVFYMFYKFVVSKKQRARLKPNKFQSSRRFSDKGKLNH